MKQKISLILTSLLIVGALAGCSGEAKTAQASYISMDNACTAALTAAGVDASDANVTDTQLTERNGMAYYEVDFTVADKEYTYAIDAMTGVVIEAKDVKQASYTDDGDQVTDYDTANTEATSDDTANKHTAPVVAPPAAASIPKAPTSGTTEVTLEQAKRAALDHAGKTDAEVTFVKAQKDFDDGQWIYEIEFIAQSGNSYQEYDYELSVSTGKILSYDQDAESYAPQTQNSTTKTEDEVRNIALAKVPGAKKEHCSLRLERDDGRVLYEGKIIYDGMEYEFEIDAYSGTVLDWEAESIYD